MGAFTTSRLGLFSAAVVFGFGGLLVACTNSPTEPAPVVMGSTTNTMDIAGPVTLGAEDIAAPSAARRTALRQAPPRNHTARVAHQNRHRVANKEHHPAPTAKSAHRKNPNRAV